MKHYFIVICSVALVSCKPVVLEEIYTAQPLLELKSSYTSNQFVEGFFTTLHFSYNEGTQVDSNGKFSYISPDGTSDSTLINKTKHFYSSETIVLSREDPLFLRTAEATLVNDSLVINLSDTPFSHNWYEISIVKTKGKPSFQYYQTTFILDSSYRPPEFSVIEHHILFDKMTYQKGDTVKAKIIAKVAALHTWGSVYRDTLNVYGLIKTLVR